jgi:hypothetical protein
VAIREFLVRESTWTKVPLDSDQAAAVMRMGSRLAAQEAWWGATDTPTSTSVVDVRREVSGETSILFREVIGVVRVGDLQIRVESKIPATHLNYIISFGEILPRIDRVRADLAAGASLPDLVATWLIWAIEKLIRGGLEVGYHEEFEELHQVRGRVACIETAITNAMGRAVVFCEFEELGVDTPRNRILLAACRAVAGFPGFRSHLRARARQLIERFTLVGPLRHSDRQARPDRLSRRYADALELARIVLSGGGIDATIGRCVGSAYLIRTPELVEDGLRNLLARLLPDARVEKRKIKISQSGLTLNPDLVFCKGLAVADIKYRMLTKDWNYPNLYQAVAFAAAFKSNLCAIIGFTSSLHDPIPQPVLVGSVSGRAFSWNADSSIAPEISAARVADALREWLVTGGALTLGPSA